MTDPALRPVELVAALAHHAVDYVVIGGFAAIAHGSPRATRDLDIVVAPTSRNLARLQAALAELGAKQRVAGGRRAPIDEAAVALVALGTTVHAITSAGSLDIVGAPAGAPPYDKLSARSVATRIGDIELRVAGLDDLVAMKRAAGRPLDLQDIADLTERE